MRVLVSGVFSGWVLGPGQYAGARGGSGSLGVGALVRGGGFCDLGTATIYNPSRLTDDRKLLTDTSSSAPDKCTTITYHTLYTTIHITTKEPGTHGRGALIRATRNEWGCESDTCVCSGSYVPGGVGLWIALSVLYISNVRDTQRDPLLITTFR
ncbi:hypothetical protein DPMN_077586 [Dreissena polymorpha]|uniref:Uncharacterized protein n=1 Tax=Dreissena polymorpha TaxID=45954 RepID=A0A9D3YKR7_DREPO|nr:hypothetical protein DPMN_077586 [Dreissena polymorpha]